MSTQLPEPIQFGKYTLFERIGRGGMAEVFKGRISGPAGFERVFVVKRILPHLSDDQSFIRMFVEEAKLSARLNHPNIVHIFELGAVEGEYFISMEHIHGRDLSDTMRAIWKTMGPPRPELVAYIGREACRGLAYAHGLTDDTGRSLGMIHRDVSPSNVMLSYEGAVKMLDFGIAKALGDQGEVTKSGTMKGKYAYMAPEQTEGDNIDHRSDIFACGIVLHEVLTGRRLFKGQNDVQTIERVRRCEVPRPSLQNANIPRELDAVVLKALARHPDHRWQNAADMADALDDVVHAARYQPTHLAQLLYELFPADGGAPRAHAASASQISRIPTATGSKSGGSASGVTRTVRSRTVPPVSRTVSGAVLPAPEIIAPPPSIQPKSNFMAVMMTLLVLGGGGVAAWKLVLSKRYEGTRTPSVVSDPSRRFHVFVKSTPEGADIFLGEGKRPIGATPVTLPIDLTGVTSVRITLKKTGYEDYQQIVVDDTPLSISLAPSGGTPPAPAPAGAGGAPGASPSGGSAAPKSKPSRKRRAPKVEAESDEPAGEIAE